MKGVLKTHNIRRYYNTEGLGYYSIIIIIIIILVIIIIINNDNNNNRKSNYNTDSKIVSLLPDTQPN